MNKADLFEHVRSLLRDAQTDAGINNPQTYGDEDLIPQVRSALRHLVALGLETDAAMSTTGVLSPEPTPSHGVLIAHRVASVLLRGDMISRVVNGEMGVVFQMGNDVIDTKTAAIQFANAAAGYDEEFKTLLTIALSTYEPTVFGGPLSPGDKNL